MFENMFDFLVDKHLFWWYNPIIEQRFWFAIQNKDE